MHKVHVLGPFRTPDPATRCVTGLVHAFDFSLGRRTDPSATRSSANRGNGFELVKQLLAPPSNLVVATCRNPDKATALSDLKTSAKGMLRTIELDVTDFANVRASAKEVETILGDIGLDYLVNNAAVVRAVLVSTRSDAATTDSCSLHLPAQVVWDSVCDIDPEKLVDILRTNTVGPALILQVYLPLLGKGRAKTILHISSTGGSFASFEGLIAEEHRKLGAYALSKAALNMLVPTSSPYWFLWRADNSGRVLRLINRRSNVPTSLCLRYVRGG